MADDKSKDTDSPGADEQLKQRVDQMMDIKGGKDGPPAIDDDAGVSEVVASINQSLSHDLNPEEASLTPELETAPELPVEPAEPDVEPTAELPVEEPASPDADTPPLPDSDVDDSYTQKAVDDIVAKESDQLLAEEDKKTNQASKAVVSKTSFTDKIRRIFKNRRFWLVLLIIIIATAAIPVTRYSVLGLLVKKTVSVTVIDSKTSRPVSNADVSLGGKSAKTNANGKAQISASLGERDLAATKRYYKAYSGKYLVGFKTANAEIKLEATGRLVPITVVNKITGKPVSNALVVSQGTTAKTNSKGLAEIALPAKAASYPGKIITKGYNTTEITITATDKVVKANTHEITPSGQVYFLSNRSGTLDVVKSNLDGSGRKTVLAGTGKEDPRSTSLLASRDWRYLVLKAQREGSHPALYLIDTSTDKSTQFDSGDSDFSLIGWSEHSFVYSLSRNNLGYSQTGKQAVKSYDADRSQLNQLDQTTAEGAAGNSAYQSFANFYILKDLVVYSTQWNKESNVGTVDISAKNDTIRGIQPSGQNKKDYQSFPSANNNYIQASLYEPQGIYFAVYDNNSKPTFYSFEDQAVKAASIDQATFDKTYPTFLISPNASQTFWAELRDGKNALFTGDLNAGNKKQLADSSEYAPYGWYSDSYVLVSKNGSELYILPAKGANTERQPLKVTDYYKPALTYAGYGYGYGGI